MNTPHETRPPAPDENHDSMQVAWGCLASAPGTCVYLQDANGAFLYANAQLSEVLFGAQGRDRDIAGCGTHEVLPELLACECDRRRETARRTGKPVLARLLWKGHQFQLWTTPVPPESPDEQLTYLTIARVVEGDIASLNSTDEIQESQFVSLGDLDVLSPGELEVLALLGQGLSAKEIAKVLGRSARTIEGRRAAIGHKLDINDRVTLAQIAQRAGLTLRDASRERLSDDAPKAPTPPAP
ncbi:MAG: response regulator transcription factor [Phycisphaerales bacterium]|nr:response regulator transcription factor [Phycisphaerales bacterium]